MDLWHANKFGQHFVVDVLLSYIKHSFGLILVHQWLKSYLDGREYWTNIDNDLFWLIRHNFPSSFKICFDYLVVVIAIIWWKFVQNTVWKLFSTERNNNIEKCRPKTNLFAVFIFLLYNDGKFEHTTHYKRDDNQRNQRLYMWKLL